MAFEEYHALKELLVQQDLDVIGACEHFCQSDRQPLALAVLKIARFSNKELLLIRALIQREIHQETQVLLEVIDSLSKVIHPSLRFKRCSERTQ